MRKDDRQQLTEEFARALLETALANRHDAEPRAGLEERVLTNLRQQAQTRRPLTWHLAPVMIAVAAVLLFIAIDHLMSRAAVSAPVVIEVAKAGETGGGVAPNALGGRMKADEKSVAIESAKQRQAFTASRRARSSPRQPDLALNQQPRREDERAASGIRVEEVRITEVRLDDIVIGNNERQE